MSDTQSTTTRRTRVSAKERLAAFDAEGRDQRFADYVANFDAMDAARRACLETEVYAEVFTQGMISAGPSRRRRQRQG